MENYDIKMLTERAKELECMYAVDEILQNNQLSLNDTMNELLLAIPKGFSAPDACRVKIILSGDSYHLTDFSASKELCRTSINVKSGDGTETVGEIIVGYIPKLLTEDYPLLSNEITLLQAISRRIADLACGSRQELSLFMDMFRHVDPEMMEQIWEKLRIYLKNNTNAMLSDIESVNTQSYGETNSPMPYPPAEDKSGKKLINYAATFIPQKKLYGLLQSWIQEQRIFALVRAVDSKDARISSILDAVQKYSDEISDNELDTQYIETWLISELAHRFLTNDENVINVILNNLRITNYIPMLKCIISSESSMGNIGGKSAGLFIAGQILKCSAEEEPLLSDIKLPRSWYLATDQIVDFLHYNHMEELNSYKYNSLMHIRMTYDNIVSRIKSARLPPHTVHMLRIVIEDLDGKPIIVRSSSLLEDRHNGVFSGKYKSLFLANIGTRKEKLAALIDAVLEVYSSMYNPDAIQYRRERGLLNYTEQMGILIQEVVGKRVGKYFMPMFAGVAFSQNLFRWSERINKDDGLVRMVMGLGTRAVDRVNDDYPILFAPAKPGLQVNQSSDDIRRYSQKHIDLLNLESGCFETVETKYFFKDEGKNFTDLYKYVSVYNQDILETKNAFSLNPQKDDMVITFDHILSSTDISKKLHCMLNVLSEKFDCPIDLEFAYNGENIYLLQCRPQAFAVENSPAPIPKNLNKQDIIFTANRFISNALIKGITHIVYVDGDGYDGLSSKEELLAVGKAIGRLNDILPYRKFILIGPGRWGSRGDIKLGVRVTYSDISGTQALIEVAREKQSYMPELSFGTHFFQDLVESGIVYIPLYPDRDGAIFKESVLMRSKNDLSKLLPEYSRLSDVLKVIDIPSIYTHHTLSIHMNADLDQAVAFLDTADENKAETGAANLLLTGQAELQDSRQHWQWRQYMAQEISESADLDGFGIKGIYLFGSTNTASTGMGSDIDLLIHFDGDDSQKELLNVWLDGWSRALARINYLHTGYNTEHLLDVHIVTDEDIKNKNSFAIKIGSATDPAAPLRIR